MELQFKKIHLHPTTQITDHYNNLPKQGTCNSVCVVLWHKTIYLLSWFAQNTCRTWSASISLRWSAGWGLARYLTEYSHAHSLAFHQLLARLVAQAFPACQEATIGSETPPTPCVIHECATHTRNTHASTHTCTNHTCEWGSAKAWLYRSTEID